MLNQTLFSTLFAVLFCSSTSHAQDWNAGGPPPGYAPPPGPYGYAPPPNYAPAPPANYARPPRHYGYGPTPGYGNLTPGYHPYRNSNSWSPWSGRSGGWNRPGWGGNRNPFRHRSPRSWFDMDKDSMSDNWDDMLNAPSRMGRMPGGWEAPSVSVPNPIDVGDELGDAARDVPDQMRNMNSDY